MRAYLINELVPMTIAILVGLATLAAVMMFTIAMLVCTVVLLAGAWA